MSNAMKVGHFCLMPGELSILEAVGIEEWEKHAKRIFFMHKNMPWWIGDMVNFGLAQFGDDFWQVLPEDASGDMTMRFAAAAARTARKDRFPTVYWTNHQHALQVENETLRKALLRKAARERMDSESFLKLIKETVGGKKGT